MLTRFQPTSALILRGRTRFEIWDRQWQALITPHGDRKPQSSAPHRLTTYDLITPHGDRKRCRVHQPGPGYHPLITPHGDRKPCPSQSRHDVHPGGPHYPSWGSETSQTSAACLPQRHLITPHGDRKPLVLAVRGVGEPDLITPHGDRKRIQYSIRVDHVLPHYPSWGSETYLWRPRHWFDNTSLPLMGIGNRGARPCLPDMSTISLPLMGIGNITRCSGNNRGLTTHYPSWGSETTITAGNQETL